MKIIYKLYVILILLFLIIPNQAGADGWWPLPPTWKLIYSPYQKAVIVWNPKTKNESMILSTTAKTDSIANLCWIVPIKSITEPEVEDSEFEIFWDISRLFTPTYI